MPPESPDLPTEDEEDALLEAHARAEGPGLGLDLPGRLRKLRSLIVNPRALFAELAAAPDILTPLLLVTLVALIALAAGGERVYAMMIADFQAGLAQAPESVVPADQRANLPESLASLQLFFLAGMGVNHILLCGVYALAFYGLAWFLDFKPIGYAQLLSVMSFAWLPRPLWNLGVHLGLLASGRYDSWLAMQEVQARLHPGLHALFPRDIPFTEFWQVAAYYLLFPADLFLLLAVMLLTIAGPSVLQKPPGAWKLALVSGLLFLLLLAGVARLRVEPNALRAMAAHRAEASSATLDSGS